jgi:hypothetical protein
LFRGNCGNSKHEKDQQQITSKEKDQQLLPRLYLQYFKVFKNKEKMKPVRTEKFTWCKNSASFLGGGGRGHIYALYLHNDYTQSKLM